VFALVFCYNISLSAQELSLLEQGKQLLYSGKISEAAAVLESAAVQAPSVQETYLHLGLAYEQLGNYDRAVKTLQRAFTLQGPYKALIYFNAGNNFFKQGSSSFAEEMYSKALEADRTLSGALLNRANARIKIEKYQDALADYTLYLALNPSDPQKENIEKIITLLRGAAEDEAARLAEDEKKRLEAEARRKALLGEVLSSLQNASEDTKSFSAGSETIQIRETEPDIED
jgi:tetratricopeptide (TPR) repeat protein